MFIPRSSSNNEERWRHLSVLDLYNFSTLDKFDSRSFATSRKLDPADFIRVRCDLHALSKDAVSILELDRTEEKDLQTSSSLFDDLRLSCKRGRLVRKCSHSFCAWD